MFVEEIRRAVMGSPRAGLQALAGAIWKGHAAGALSEDEAQQLAELIEAQKAVSAVKPPPQPQRRTVGSRPRSPASTERRRRWSASGWMPPQIAARFTVAEIAVLSVIAAEVVKPRGMCRLTIGHVAAVAGVSRTTVKNALREAKALGLVTVEEWRLTAWRSAPNTVKVVSREWLAWLRLAARRGGGRGGQGSKVSRGGGVNSVIPTSTHRKQAWSQAVKESIGNRGSEAPGRSRDGHGDAGGTLLRVKQRRPCGAVCVGGGTA